LLIVDDEVRQMEALCRTLEPEGYEVTGFTSPHDAVASLRERTYDIVLTDLMMPGMDGITLLRTALEMDADLVGILMTGEGTVTTAVDAMKVGALDYILKPFKLSAIRPVLTRALGVRRLRMENIRLREAVGIYELSQSIARTLDAHAILEKIAEAAFQQSYAHEVLVLVGDARRNVLGLGVSRSRGTARDPEWAVPITDDLLAWAARSSERLSQLDEGLPGGPIQAPGLADAPTRLALPMLAGGRLTGVLTFEPLPGRSIAPGQIRALSVLASAGATALEVSALVAQLRRTNEDLRQVAWAASHDLQEPLRMIALYTELLGQTYAGKGDAKSDELVSYAAEGSKRILGMLRELRTYVEAGDRAAGSDMHADSGRAVARALAHLRSAIEAGRADVHVAELPTVRMNEAHLAEVFARLIDNAIKFRRPDTPARVAIAATRAAGMWTFSILDEGMGIDPAYHTQIFELFKRLNRREEYTGHGMGLPICRRIVEAYGGSLWVESQEHQGARFCFSVPALTGTA
jgi:signal transduction histidine kinase